MFFFNKIPTLCSFFALTGIALASASPNESRRVTLTVIAYDSFASKHGLGPVVKSLFEAQCGCDLKILPSGDAVQMLSRLELDTERKKISAQVAIGIDQSLWPRAKPLAESWGEKKDPIGFDKILKELKIAPDFFPFDYGTYAWMADTQALNDTQVRVPGSWSDLEKPEYQKKLLIEDPRTSTPGLGLLLYTKSVYGEKFQEFWKKMRSQWLTLPMGWSQAYGLFLKGQAPLVWSYTTSQAYHVENPDKSTAVMAGKSNRYQAILLKNAEGHTEAPMQVEGAILIRGGSQTPDQRKLAHQFIEFLMSEGVQNKVALGNWMLPARGDVKLPESFTALPVPHVKKVITPKNRAEVDLVLKEWQEAILKP